MNRRKFLATTLAAPLAGLTPPRSSSANDASPPLQKWRRFQITTEVTLAEAAGPAQLWVPLAQTAGGYQSSLCLDWESTGRTECVYDARYGAPILRTTWEENDRPGRRFVSHQIVDGRDRNDRPLTELSGGTWTGSPLLPLTEAERRLWTAPTPSVPLDGVVLATAARITAGQSTPRERLRAIYDWVVDHTHRDPDVPGCGRGEIKAFLERGVLGGKCADINGLMVGLARAAGFPARDVYGIRVAPSRWFSCVGADRDISKAQHCRAEIYLEDAGWFPVDPADVGKVIAAEKLARDDPKLQDYRDHQFGNWEMNWFGYNSATDIELPGIAAAHRPDFAFLMYPCAFTSDGSCPCTDPAHFQYAISAREVPI